jgi:hypothetical protein
VLLAAASAVGTAFRHLALASLSPETTSWDAALHALSGLDFFDDMRLLRPLSAAAGLLSLHWWPPGFAFLSAPCFAIFGRTLPSATLPSFFSYLLAAPCAFLAAAVALGNATRLEALAAALLAGAVMLTSPMLLEISAWPMLESTAGLVAAAAWMLAFLPGRRAARATFLAGAAAFFLKYHYGFFLLATLAADVALESREALRPWAPRLAAALRKPIPLLVLSLAALVAALRLALEAAGGDAKARILPSVSNVLWLLYVLALVWSAVRRDTVRAFLSDLPPRAKDFLFWGVLPCAMWCLDPANVRAWYRQFFQLSQTPVRNPLAQLTTFGQVLSGDYLIDPALAVALVGVLVLAFVLAPSPRVRLFALFPLWPVLLMSLGRYPVEARFLASSFPSAVAAATLGVLLLSRRAGPRAGPAVLALLLAAAAAVAFRPASRARLVSELEERSTYRYALEGEDLARARREIAAASTLPRPEVPADSPVWPTVRLAVRLSRPAVPPDAVGIVP